MSLSSCPTLTDLNQGADMAVEKPASSPSLTKLEPAASSSDEPTLDGKGAMPDLAYYEGSGKANDPYIICFTPGDRENPYNWRPLRKWAIVAQVSMACLCTAFGSSVFAGGIQALQQHFKTSHLVSTLGLSCYVLGFATGPLLWGGTSEWVGRQPVFIGTYVPFILCNFGCVMSTKSFAGLAVLRFFAGTFGSSTLTLSGATVADCFNAEERALAMSVFALAPFMGPVLGPIAGGFLGVAAGWRWLLGLQTIFSVVIFLTGLFTPETYAPVLLSRRVKKLSKLHPDLHFISAEDIHKEKISKSRQMWINLTRPFVFLTTELSVFLFALYAAIVYGVLYGLFGAFPVVFQETRGWSPGVGGLAFLGMGVAQCLASVATVFLNRRYVAETARKGPLPPEARLSSCIIGGLAIPIGMFWFAWTCQPSVHFIVPIIGSSLFGFGSVLLFLGMTNWMVDSYTRYSGSALAANAVFRSILGAAFPLFIVQLFHSLGNSWALTLIAFVSLALVPIPVLFLKYGPAIRARSKYAPGHKEPTGDTMFRTKEELETEVLDNDLHREKTHESVVRKASRDSNAV